jgi:hypothetical protein
VDEFRVESVPDARGYRVPARVGRAGFEQRVSEVLDRWPGRDHTYFRVCTEAGDVLILRHAQPEGSWELVFFERAPDRDSGRGGQRSGAEPSS